MNAQFRRSRGLCLAVTDLVRTRARCRLMARKRSAMMSAFAPLLGGEQTCRRHRQNDAIDPNVWSGRASQEVSSSWRLAVLHQCIRPLIGAFAPGHHGYQRACDLVSGQASTGHSGHQCSHAPGRPILHLFSSSRRPRQVVSSLRMITRLEACSPRRLGHAQERSMRCGPACWRARSPGRCGAAASWQPPARA